MPKGTPKAKVVSINAFEQLQEEFEKLREVYNSLLERVYNEAYFREAKTRLGEDNRIISNRYDGLCVALAICGNRIANLDNILADTNVELSESYHRSRNEVDNSAKAYDVNYVGESLGRTEPSNPPIQPTTKATIKPKIVKTKQKLRRKK